MKMKGEKEQWRPGCQPWLPIELIFDRMDRIIDEGH
jgi:hypothetical protein